MDIRALLFVAFALLCICIPSAHATTVAVAIIGDEVYDNNGRFVELTITTTASASGGYPSVCVSPTGPTPTLTATPAGNVNSIVLTNTPTACPTSGTADCVQNWVYKIDAKIADPTFCNFGSVKSRPEDDGPLTALTFTYTPCQGGAPQTATTQDIKLRKRNVCKSKVVQSLAATITPSGPFSDAGLSQTKTHYFLNDVAYFPFLVTYHDLTISSFTFSEISVLAPGTTEPVVLYNDDSKNSGAGNVVDLQTSPITTQLSSGASTAWFSVEINREEGSPFANATTTSTFVFNVVFEATYKNAKRGAAEVETTKLVSKAAIRIVPEPAHPLISAAPVETEAQAGSASTVAASVAGLVVVGAVLAL